MIIFLLFLFLFPQSIFAQETPIDTVYYFPPIEVESRRGVLYLDDVSTAVTVLTSRKIEASGVQNLGELLKPVTGVYVSEYGSAGTRKTLSLRGSAADQVLILVDGKKINPIQSGAADLAQISVENIDRIEVLRSGGSVLWGAESIGGIINILTKDGRGIGEKFWAKAEYGSFETKSFTTQFSGQTVNWDYLFTSKYLDSEGVFTFKESWRESYRSQENNDYEQINISSKLGWIFHQRSKSRLELAFDKSESQGGVPGTIEFPTPKARKEEDFWAISLTLSSKNILFKNHGELQIYKNFAESHYENPQKPFPFEGTHENVAQGLQGKFKSRFLNLGFEYREDKLKSQVTENFGNKNETHKRITKSFFLYGKKDSLLKKVALNLGLRFDAFSDYEEIWSLEGGANLPFSQNLIIRSNLATAYKMPSFNDLFWSSTSFALGNSNLEPEKSVNFDFGIIIYPGNKIRMESTYFRKNIKNLIQWNAGAGGVWRPKNLEKVLIQGIENELYFPIIINNIFLIENTANYTFLSPINKSGNHATHGKKLVRRPQHQGNISLAFHYKDRFQMQGQWRYVGMRYTNDANTKSIPAYNVTDLHSKFYLNKNWELSVKVKNFFDEKYVDVWDFPIPGREFKISLKFKI